MNENFTRKITVTFESEEAAKKLFAHLSGWDGIQQSNCQVSIIDTWGVVEDIWSAICSDEVDFPDQLLSISLERVTSSSQV